MEHRPRNKDGKTDSLHERTYQKFGRDTDIVHIDAKKKIGFLFSSRTLSPDTIDLKRMNRRIENQVNAPNHGQNRLGKNLAKIVRCQFGQLGQETL